jgi:hypothetical protein
VKERSENSVLMDSGYLLRLNEFVAQCHGRVGSVPVLGQNDIGEWEVVVGE